MIKRLLARWVDPLKVRILAEMPRDGHGEVTELWLRDVTDHPILFGWAMADLRAEGKVKVHRYCRQEYFSRA